MSKRMEVLHIVGGGFRKALLNQLAANACGRPVLTGPVEATVMGNILTQVRASGELKSQAEMRDVVRASSEMGRFEPKEDGAWTDAAAKFAALTTWPPSIKQKGARFSGASELKRAGDLPPG